MHATKEQRVQNTEMIIQWQQSGLSQKSYCATNNIAYHVFHYWYGVYKREQKEQKGSGSFLPVSITSASNPEQLTIRGLNGIQLQVSLTDESVGFIKKLLHC